VELVRSTDASVQSIQSEPDVEAGRLHAFLRAINGDALEDDLTTAELLQATRCALRIQRTADENRTNVRLGEGD
jgi:hypothetical protein